MTKTNYGIYSEIELYRMLNEPWELTDKPYMLYTAYALSCLSEALDDECEDGNGDSGNGIWGKTVPEKILRIIVKNAAEDFNFAARNHTRIDVWGRSLSVRKADSYDPDKLVDVFDFKLVDDEYVVSKDGVRKLSEGARFGFQNNKEAFNRNKSFLRKVIMLAEDDKNDGWNKLTDMEVAVYCWALFYRKHQNINVPLFMKEYNDYIDVTVKDLLSCINDSLTNGGEQQGMYAFDQNKVARWNDSNGQVSFINGISDCDADDYWYDVALKGTFKQKTQCEGA